METQIAEMYYPSGTTRHDGVRTPTNRAIILEHRRNNLSLQFTADTLGCSRKSLAKWLKEDQELREDYEDAREGHADRIEDEIHRRGVRGVRKGIWHQGKRVGYERVYSDGLLEKAAAAARPEKWGKSSVEVTGEVKHQHAHVHMTLEELQEAAIARGLPIRLLEE